MRILVELTHPAQVHFFRYAIEAWRRGGHTVLAASRRKDCLVELLDQAGIEHACLSRRRDGLVGLGWELAGRYVRMLRLIGRFRPDVIVGRFCISGSLAGWLMRRPVVVFEDTEHASLQQKLTLPFATVLCTTEFYGRDLGRRQIRYAGIDRLAYTHPRYFQPDPAVARRLGLEPGGFCLLRLVSWQAAHDRGVRGLTAEEVERLIALLEPHGRVVLSSEGAVPPRWQRVRLDCPASDMLHLLGLARIYVGEGGSMAAEAACLGVPAVYVNPLELGYLRVLEGRFGLVRCAATVSEALEAAERMLAEPPEHWRGRRVRLLEQCQDVTQFVIDIVQRVGCVK